MSDPNVPHINLISWRCEGKIIGARRNRLIAAPGPFLFVTRVPNDWIALVRVHRVMQLPPG